MTFRSILCPIDFSLQSRTALLYAMAMAQRFHGRLTAMFVNDEILLAAQNAAFRGRRRFVDRTTTELARFVNASTKALPVPRESIRVVTSVGNPAEEILRQTKRLRADLVVMGTHGLSGLQKMFFGSTTEQVLRRAAVPVLAIPSMRGSRRRPTIAAPFVHVIAPIDLAGEWQPDAVRAADIAAEFHASLLLVHVLAPVQRPPWLAQLAGPSDDQKRILKAKRALERVRSKLFSHLQSMSTAVILGDPAHEIAGLASRPGSLVVMSLRGTAGVWGMRRGAVAYRVLTQSSAPVLALPRRRIGGRLAARAKKASDDILRARDRAEIAGLDALLSAGATANIRR
jgi:nucleotide-binding universal stress UspA family protein